jgi:hypothetical protein
MVGPVLMEADGRVDSVSDLCDAFATLFQFKIDTDEIQELLDGLERDNIVKREGSAIVLAATVADGLLRRRRQFEQVSAQAMQEWRVSLIMIEPSLTDQELQELVADLERLVAHVVGYHGAEAVLILYPEEERSSALRETLRAKVQGLPTRGSKLDEIRRRGLAQFFSAPTEAQRHYLADRLDFGFFATVGTLGPEAARAIKEELSGQRLYLDTNMLIAGLGLAGRNVNESTRRLLTQSQELGLELAVTSCTLNEFRHSISRAEDQVTSRGLPGRRYAPVLARVARELGGVSLTEGYYENYAKHGASPREWFRRAGLLVDELGNRGIRLIDDGLLRVERNEEGRVNDYVVLLNREAAFRGRRPRDDAPMEHDAVHRVLIERLRGDGHRGFGSAQYWFLTQDKILPRFGQLALEGEQAPAVPFCISSAAWTQIVRSFTPRTQDYDQMITDLLASPYLRFGQARDLREVQSVVSRISVLLGDEGSPTVVASFVNDETLEAAAKASDQTEEDVLLQEAYRQAEDVVGQRVTTLTQRLEETEIRLNAEKAERDNMSGAVEQTRAEEYALKQQLEQMQEALRERESAIHEKDRALQQERALSGAEITRLKREHSEHEAREKKTAEGRRRFAAILVAIIVFAAVIALAAREIVPVWVLVAGGALSAWMIAPVARSSRIYWRLGAALAVASVLLGVVSLLE